MEPLPSSSQRVNEEPLSIYELARRQPTKRILVEPLLWTRLHLETLSCTFSQCSPVPLAVMDIPWTEKPHVVAYIFQDFEKCFFGDRNSWTAKEASIRSFLSFEPSPLSWHCDLYLHIGRNRNVALPCHYYCLSNYLPIAAHVDQRRISSLRNNKARLSLRRSSIPTFKLNKLRLKKITPPEPLYDPYLVALLFALGQLQWRALGQQKLHQAAGVTPKVLFSSEDHDQIYVYSANISASLLNMFYYPAMKPPAPNSLAIQISSIPYRPVETLRGRLLAFLLSATNPEDVDIPEKLIVYT